MKKALSLLLALCFFVSAFPLVLAAGEAEISESHVPTIVGTKVNINFDITVKFYLRAPEGTTSCGLYISEDGRTATRVGAELCEEEEMDDGSYYVVSYQHVTVDEMTVPITVTPWGMVGTSFVRGKQSYDFTLQDYAMRLLYRADLSTKEKDVLLAMLNYGSAVQDVLGYRLYNKPNALLTDAERRLPDASSDNIEDLFKPTNPASLAEQNEGLAKADITSITLAQTGYLRFWFYVDIEGQQDLRINGGAGLAGYMNMSAEAEAKAFCGGYRVEVTCDGITKLYELEKDEDGFGFTAATGGISFLDLREEMSFRILSDDGTVSQTYYCSVARYFEQAQEGEALTPEIEELLLRAFAFGDALNAYKEAK